MSTYTYIAKSTPQQSIKGNIEADSEQEAINKLTKMGLFPISVLIQNLTLEKTRGLSLKKIGNRDVVIFTRQLSTLIVSGVNILNGLNIVANQAPNKYFKAILNDVINKIKDGQSLSRSLSSYPDIFSNLYTSTIHSGEVGGHIEVSLNRLADFLEKTEEFKNSIRASLAYPLFVLIVGAATIVILLGFVIPRLVTMFEDMGQILPLPTRILIGLSGFLHTFGWLILGIIILSIFLLRRFFRTWRGKILWDNFKLKRIILGKILLRSEISRLMRTLSLLLSSGITIIYSLDISISVIENQILKLEMQKFKDKINDGLSFSQCLKDSKLFPPFVTNIITVGEETGTLEKSLLRIADDYERQVDRSLKNLVRLLEPVIILVMGLIVGFIVLSMLLPIFQINLIVR
jgi:type II secretory pathway component PulF